MKKVLIGSKTNVAAVASKAATAGITTRGCDANQSQIQCDFIFCSKESRSLVISELALFVWDVRMQREPDEDRKS
jgi:hypothetical protein